MTVDEALARMRSRWDHAPIDRHDVEERVALRLVDALALEVRVLGPQPPACPACRIFFRVRHDGSHVSRYVHSLGDVDAVLADLLEVATTAATVVA